MTREKTMLYWLKVLRESCVSIRDSYKKEKNTTSCRNRISSMGCMYANEHFTYVKTISLLLVSVEITFQRLLFKIFNTVKLLSVHYWNLWLSNYSSSEGSIKRNIIHRIDYPEQHLDANDGFCSLPTHTRSVACSVSFARDCCQIKVKLID